MAIGARIGSRVGARIGTRIGSSKGGAAVSTTTQTVTVADSADPVITGGDAFAYTVQYTNTGAITATSVSVVVTVDSSLAITGQSGTGWSLSVVGQVVTCTRATAAVGAAPAITINVTTGGAAVTATTSAQATASNAATANGSQDTTVNFVTKDAALGWYLPSTATECANFDARKGLTAATPSNLWTLQDASGSPADAVGAAPLTVTGTPSYQQTKAGASRFFMTSTDASTVKLNTTATPNTSATSQLFIGLAYFPSNPAAARNIIAFGVTGTSVLTLLSNGKLRAQSNTNQLAGANTVTDGVLRLIAFKYDITGTAAVVYTDTEKLAPTFSAASGASFSLFSSGTAGAEGWGYGILYTGAAAQMSDAQVKARLQAMGATITWT